MKRVLPASLEWGMASNRSSAIPELGLVCLSSDGQCSFRSLTRTRFLGLAAEAQEATLSELYWNNLQRLHWTLGYCARRRIRLYRMTSALFPMSDEPLGESVLRSMGALLSSVGRRAASLGIRVVLHPDQFVVLNSENPGTCQTSARILEKHALWFDLMGLPRSAWSVMNIHGGKAGRAEELIRAIRALPPGVRSRLTLENDEYSYGADAIHDICRAAGVPMVFDCHHHVIKERLEDYDHPSVAKFTRLARDTWPDPKWQLVHVSNGESAFHDRYHSLHITRLPRAFGRVPWIEVEARGKELAVLSLREALTASQAPMGRARA